MVAAALFCDISSRQDLSLPPESPQPLPLMVALGLVRKYLREKGGGYRFTSQALFARLPLEGDKRSRGALLRILKGEGLIRWLSITKADQDGRNRGYGGLWEVMHVGYEEPQTVEKVKVGEHFQTWSSTMRNELIASGEWRQVALTTNTGKYILEKVK